MAQLFVCGRDEMPRHVRRLKPTCLVSLLPELEQPPTPPSIDPANHLRLMVLDFDDPVAGAPERRHVEELVAFLRARPGASVLLHCMAGVSRSTAAALVAMTLDCPGREIEAGQMLRERGPHAYPNRRILEHADAILGRDGRLLAIRDTLEWDGLGTEPALVTLPRWTCADGLPEAAPPSAATPVPRPPGE